MSPKQRQKLLRLVTGVIVVITAMVDRLTVVIDTDVECGSVTAADVETSSVKLEYSTQKKL